MTRELTAYEILEIAEKMERTAAAFYRKAAGMYHDPKLSKMLSDLAQWEKRHIEVFAEMKQRLSEQSWGLSQYGTERGSVPGRETPTEACADPASPSRELTGRETKAEVLQLAIRKEKDSIAYYTDLKGRSYLDSEDAQVIGDIIEEEERHVRILTQSLEQLS